MTRCGAAGGGGKSDLVVMSQVHYDRLAARLELYQKLDEAEVHARPGGGSRPEHRAVMRKLRARRGPIAWRTARYPAS